MAASFLHQCYSLTISWKTNFIQCRGCIVFHCMERSCLFNQSCTDGDSSFYKFLLSICYVIDNCAEHCGSAVSRVEIFICVKSAEPGAELPNRCAETWNDEPGDVGLVCPCSSWAVPKTAGKTWFCCLSLFDAPLRRAVINEAVCLCRLGAEWVTWAYAVPLHHGEKVKEVLSAVTCWVHHGHPLWPRVEGVCIPGAQEHVARCDQMEGRPGELTRQWQLQVLSFISGSTYQEILFISSWWDFWALGSGNCSTTALTMPAHSAS